MPSRVLQIDGSSTSSPDGGLPQAPVTPYHVIYMSDACAINRPTSHVNFSTGGETLSVIGGRAASLIALFATPPVLNVLTLQLGQNDFIAGGPYANKVAAWVTDVEALRANIAPIVLPTSERDEIRQRESSFGAASGKNGTRARISLLASQSSMMPPPAFLDERKKNPSV
jgi:hypothetical protein